MNINRIWFWIVFACLVSGFSTAQRYEIGVSLGGVNYVGEIGSTQYIQPRHLEVGIIFKQHFSERIGVRGVFGRGKLSGNDASASELDRLKRNLFFDYNYITLGIGIEVNYVELPIGDFGFSWTPYIHAGVNRLIIDDLYFKSFENTPQGMGKTTTISIPFGIGVKFNFGQSWILAAEVQPQFTMSDNLDGSYPDLEKNPTARQFSTSLSNDWLVFTGISITYGFGRLPCCRE